MDEIPPDQEDREDNDDDQEPFLEESLGVLRAGQLTESFKAIHVKKPSAPEGRPQGPKVLMKRRSRYWPRNRAPVGLT